jgi:GT2 family glycosyltransferase
MSYLIADIEVTQPLPTLVLTEQQTGVALILRRQDRPIGFLLRQLSASAVLPPEKLEQWIVNTAKLKLLQEGMREELVLPPAPTAGFPSLTVAICTKDRPQDLARCLASLTKLQQPDATCPPRFEILVVDNAPSTEQTHDLIAAMPQVRYTREPKPGLDFARNHAVQQATGELLAFLDDDVVVDRNWLDGLIEAWAENPDAAAFTGQVLPYELETEAQILCERRGGFRHGFEKIRFGQILIGNTLYPCGAGVFGVGCNMAYRRSVLLELGGFDEALDTGASLPGGGDHDMFYRVIRAGHVLVYEPRYLVFHHHRRDYDSLRRQYSRSWGLGFTAYVTKCYLSDPPQRKNLRRLVLWWLKYEFGLLVDSLRGKQALPPDIFIGELLGGITGLLGEYSRSCKRTEQIRRQFS